MPRHVKERLQPRDGLSSAARYTHSTHPTAGGAALMQLQIRRTIKIWGSLASRLVGEYLRGKILNLPQEMKTERRCGRAAALGTSGGWGTKIFCPLNGRNVVPLPPHVWSHMGLYIAFTPTFSFSFCSLGQRSAHHKPAGVKSRMFVFTFFLNTYLIFGWMQLRSQWKVVNKAGSIALSLKLFKIVEVFEDQRLC